MRQTEIAIAKRSLALFGIVGPLKRIATGLDRSYRVKTATGRVFALRVSSGIPIRRVSAFAIEAEWIDALSGNRWFKVPQVQRTASGERLGQVEDSSGIMRASTLLSWLPGRRFYRIGNTQARTLGQMAGALHQHARAALVPPADAIKTWDASFMCGMGMKDGLHNFASEAVQLVQSVHLRLQPIVTTLASQEIGLINADLGLHNVLWHQGRAALVDFNDAGIGPYAFCLGRLMARIRGHENGQILAKELLRGYREVTPLPAAYEKWGGLFEIAAEVFRLKFSAARAARRGTALEDRELRIIRALNRKLERLGR